MGILYENREKACMITRKQALEYVAHLHKEIEIVYMLSGETKVFLDSKEYVLRAGDIFISSSNKVHYYRTYTREDSFLIIFSPDEFPDFYTFLLKNDPVNPVVRKEDISGEVRDILINAHRHFNSKSAFSKEIFKGYLEAFLGILFQNLEFKPVNSNNTDMLSAVLSYCVENYKENISLDSMATELHSSKYYISRLFSEKIKIGFNDYINMLRINEAKECLIKTNDSITQISINVGFNTIRSFNRAFLSQTGMQPREFRNMHKNSQSDLKKEEAEPVKNKPEQENGVVFLNSDFDCCF